MKYCWIVYHECTLLDLQTVSHICPVILLISFRWDIHRISGVIGCSPNRKSIRWKSGAPLTRHAVICGVFFRALVILTFRLNIKDFQAVPFYVVTPCSLIYLCRHSENRAASVFRGRLINNIIRCNIIRCNIPVVLQAIREGVGYVKTELPCTLFIMLTTTCFGHWGPSSGHKNVYRGKLYRVWSQYRCIF